MCGIIGGWTKGGDLSAVAQEALARIRHRGPDGEGYYADGAFFLGMRRLAIIDLKGGQQPIFNEDQSVAVVFNGEIYNYKELILELKARGHIFRTESDTEVLVHLYEEKGAGMVADLRGMFAFAIWDQKSQRLFLARDRFGKKPLYYWHKPEKGFVFASEIKALLPLVRAAGGRLDIRPQSIYDYLSLMTVPQPDTIYHNVCALPSASTATFDYQGLRQRCYWKVGCQSKTDLCYADILEQMRQLVRESVRLRLRSDVPLGVFLSGGLDSSIIALEASREIGEGIQTFTVATDDAALDESGVAARTALSLGIHNTVFRMDVPPLEGLQFVVRHYDQPFADSSAIPSYYVSRLAREHVKVVLNGDGGDEIFAGYRRHLAMRWLPRFQWMPDSLIQFFLRRLARFKNVRRSPMGFCSRFLRGLGQTPDSRYLAWTADAFQEEDKRLFWNGKTLRATESFLESFNRPELSPLNVQMFIDLNVNLPGLLVKMDMASMAASLEARSPMLDHKLAEFATTIPDRFLLRRSVSKSVLRDAYRDLLPREVTRGAKRGFEVPMKEWLLGDLRGILHDTVGSQNARIRAYLDPAPVRKLLDRAILQDRNWAYLVYSLLVLELWLRDAECGGSLASLGIP